MKKLLLFMLAALAVNVQNTFSWDSYSADLKSSSVDSVFQYYPLSIGNRWTWFLHNNFSPGDGYATSVIIGTQVIKNHLYYKSKWDTYYFYANQHYSGIDFKRIDSVTGNLYSLSINNNDTNDCLIDSLNSSLNDSTRIGCTPPGNWYRYSEGTYNIFGNTYPIKKFSYSTYFEGGDYHQYARSIGYVYSFGQYVMSNSTTTLRGCFINGILYGDTTVYLSVNQISSEIPEDFSLSQNYPNPFNPQTNIKFQIPESGFVMLTIFDALGREIQTIVNQRLSSGEYSVDFDGSNLPSGVYYYRLEATKFVETKKMVLIK